MRWGCASRTVPISSLGEEELLVFSIEQYRELAIQCFCPLLESDAAIDILRSWPMRVLARECEAAGHLRLQFRSGSMNPAAQSIDDRHAPGSLGLGKAARPYILPTLSFLCTLVLERQGTRISLSK